MNLKTTFLISSIVALAALASACSDDRSVETKVQDQMSKVHSLNDEERALAGANAKAFFERPWAPAGGKSGQFIACRPTDSNFNGLVTCTGFVPQPDGTMPEMKRYCGYRADLVGCSDEDTVKP